MPSFLGKDIQLPLKCFSDYVVFFGKKLTNND